MALRIVLIAIGLIVVLLLALLGVAGYALGCWPFPARAPAATAPATVTLTVPTTIYTGAPPAGTTSAGTSPLPPTSSAPGATSAPPPTAPTSTSGTSTQPPNTGVSFEMAVTSVAGSGLDYTVTARLTNSGTADAHDVQARVELFAGSDRIKINGQDFIQEDLGTLAAGQSVERQERLTISATDALRILVGGGNVTVKLTVSSTERTQQVSYDYHL